VAVFGLHRIACVGDMFQGKFDRLTWHVFECDYPVIRDPPRPREQFHRGVLIAHSDE